MGAFTILQEKMVETVQVEFMQCIDSLPQMKDGGLDYLIKCMDDAQFKTKAAGETIAENYKKLYPQFC